MANIFINALKSKTGGGKNILDNYIQHLATYDAKHTYYVLTPKVDLYEKYNSKSICIVDVPSFFKHNLLFPLLYFFKFPLLLKKFKIDLILNFGDVIIPTPVKQIYFFDWAYAVYDEDYIWKRMSKKDFLVRKIKVWLIDKYIRKVKITIGQTSNIVNRLTKKYGLKNVVLLPTPIGNEFSDDQPYFDFALPKVGLKFLFPASYASHKNFDILFPLAKLIKENSLPYVIIITLDESNANDLLKKYEKERLNDVIINVGKIDSKFMPSLYRQTDVLFLPTLLESFGLPYVEAMAYEKPIITSDLDFAHDVCGDIALYFNPFEPDSILSVMKKVSANLKGINRITIGKEKIEKQPDWEGVFLKFQEQIELSLNE